MFMLSHDTQLEALMKIVTWNCNGGFRNKLEHIDQLEADILVIQECEDPSQSSKAYQDWAGNNYIWKGESKNKGIGIFSKNGYSVQPLEWTGMFTMKGLVSKSKALEWSSKELRLFLPVLINEEYTLLGVWTKGGKESDVFGYMGQFWKYLQIHRDKLSGQKTIIAGDFNSNARWDKPDRWWNHSDVVVELGELGVQSLYHHFYGEEQGGESRPTFHLHRNLIKTYHIDYVFLSEDILSASSMEMPCGEWLSVSDHYPISVFMTTNI